MKIYNLTTKQFLPITLKEAWDFFSSPKNLKDITPTHMKFDIKYISGSEKMYPGQIITYQLQPIPGIPMSWTTEITHVDEHNYFIDEQRFGPYALWHHQHLFKEVENGVEMHDELNFALPLGILGRLAHWLFVGQKVKDIFDHRHTVLEQRFGKT